MFRVKNDELSLLLSPPEGDVRASLVMAKYKFCGHKFNNKTYKMKKILLLLSCFLATWGSVQAADGYVTSASYDANSSTITANYIANNANSAKLGLMSTSKGNSIYDPLSPQSYSIPNMYGYSSSATLKVDATLEECLFYVFLYLNGNSTPSGSMSVNVTANGSVDVSVSGNSATAKYSMQHGSTYYSSLRVYKKNANGTETQVKRIDLSSPNTNVKTNKSVSLGTYENGEYVCKLYSREKELSKKAFKINVEVPPVKGNIAEAIYTPSLKTFDVDYTLSNAKSAQMKIYNVSGKLIKRASIANSSSIKRVTFENVAFEDGYYAQIHAISKDGKNWYSNKKTLSTAGPKDVTSPMISGLGYNRSTNKIYVDFQLDYNSYSRPNGAKVEIKLMSTRQGTSMSNLITDGAWYIRQNSGRGYVTVPQESGSVMYIVFLSVNDAIVASRQIIISR